jgi:hypothetical protein
MTKITPVPPIIRPQPGEPRPPRPKPKPKPQREEGPFMGRSFLLMFLAYAFVLAVSAGCARVRAAEGIDQDRAEATDLPVVETMSCLQIGAAPAEGFSVDLEVIVTITDGELGDTTCRLIDHDEGDTITQATGSAGCELPYTLLINNTTPWPIGMFSVSIESEYPNYYFDSYRNISDHNYGFSASNCEVQ